jgi:hypothetical protein
VVSVNVGWTVDKFVEEVKESGKRKDVNGKKAAKASPNGKVKTSSPKTSAAKKAKPTKGKKATKPAKKKVKSKK